MFCSDWNPQWTFIPSSLHQLQNPWRKEESGRDVHLWERCLWRVLGMRITARFMGRHRFASSLHPVNTASLFRSPLLWTHPSLWDGEAGVTWDIAFGRQMCHTVTVKPCQDVPLEEAVIPGQWWVALCFPQSLVARAPLCPHFPTAPHLARVPS